MMLFLLAPTVVYAVACALSAFDPDAPLWLRWPGPIWNAIAHDWRQPKRRPDYAKIARLERELGVGKTDEPTP